MEFHWSVNPAIRVVIRAAAVRLAATGDPVYWSPSLPGAILEQEWKAAFPGVPYYGHTRRGEKAEVERLALQFRR